MTEIYRSEEEINKDLPEGARYSEDGTKTGEVTTDVVSNGGVAIGDIVLAVHDRRLGDKPLSDILKTPAVVVAVNGNEVDGETRINVQVLHDSHETTWHEDVTYYSSEPNKKDLADEDKVRYKDGIFAIAKRK